MSCAYCYSDNSVTDIDEDTARRAVDLAYELAPCGDPLDLGFFGGEPILRFDLMKKIVPYVRVKERQAGVKTALSVTTNGTVVNSDIFRFLREEQFAYCVSLDGPPDVHDRYRVFADGSGSFPKVAGNLRRAVGELRSVSINAVFGPETLEYLPRTVGFLLSFGVPVHLNWDIMTPWSRESLRGVDDIFQRVADVYVESFKRGMAVTLHPLEDKIKLFMVGGYRDGDKCRVGEGEWAVAPNGDIYPCERLVGGKGGAGFVMGNVRDGVDEGARLRVIANRGNRNDECAGCSVKDFCVNWCACTNWFMTGYTDVAGPATCSIEKAIIKATGNVLEELKQNRRFCEYFTALFKRECPNCLKEVERHGRKYQV